MRTRFVVFLMWMWAVVSSRGETLIEIPASAGIISPPFYVIDNVVTQTNDTAIEKGGRASYSFTITNAGEYVIQVSAAGKPGKNCTLRVCLDQETDDPSTLWQFEPTETPKRRLVGSRQGETKHRNYTLFKLQSGTHQLFVRGSSAGTKIDKILVRSHNPPGPPTDVSIAGGSKGN